MIASEKKSIEDIIVEVLARNPYTLGPDLVTLIEKTRKNTTKQAVYIALKTLLSDEIVAKVGGKYFLSRIWLHKINKLFKIQKEKELARDVIFDLKNNESISYHFPSLLACDTYWAHVVNILIEWNPENQPSFFWNPHDFFVIARKEVEEDIFKVYETINKYCFFTIGGDTPLDMKFKKTWINSRVEIATNNKLHFPSNYYLNIFGDFIIEIFLDQRFAEKIENFYKSNQKLTEENIKEFQELITKKYPVRMKISKKHEKAIDLKKKLSKDFFIPKHLSLN